MNNQNVAIVVNEDYKTEMKRYLSLCLIMIKLTYSTIDLRLEIYDKFLSYHMQFSALSGILSSGLLVVSDDCSHHQSGQIEERIAPLGEAIQKMQSIIGAYQPHEARESLCLDMASQVQRLRDIKSEMTILLEMGKICDRNPL
jgi:hypothetical protein